MLRSIKMAVAYDEITKFDSVLMRSAFIWANLSTCKRRQVGCVIAKDSRILATGYNGTISGTCNVCEDTTEVTHRRCIMCHWNSRDNLWYADDSFTVPLSYCGACKNTRKEVHKTTTKTKETVLHAEQNALMFALKEGISTKGATLYCTDAPCVTCSKLIAQAGIIKVLYNREYHDTKGIDLLSSVGVEVQRLEGS